jgi:hypothetical protein
MLTSLEWDPVVLAVAEGEVEVLNVRKGKIEITSDVLCRTVSSSVVRSLQTYLNALGGGSLEQVVEGSLGTGKNEKHVSVPSRGRQRFPANSTSVDQLVVLTTTTTLFPSLWTWTPPIVQPC